MQQLKEKLEKINGNKEEIERQLKEKEEELILKQRLAEEEIDRLKKMQAEWEKKRI